MRENWSMPFRYIVGIISFVLLVAFLVYARDAVTNLAIAGFVADAGHALVFGASGLLAMPVTSLML